jgi:NAD(P)-dependent dehydrogenase (short-subunit alcohol dehydrogenase family)
MSKPVCVVVGVGPGNGAAFARKFASEGYEVALLARNQDYLKELEIEIPGSKAFAFDVTDVEEASRVFGRIRAEMGPVEVLVYNAGSGQFGNVDDTTPEAFEGAWRVNALGCFVCAKQVIPDMREAKAGKLVIIGATASLRGGAYFAAFASAKAAQRSLAQSMARHLGPQGIHVAYVIIDGMIDLERTRKMMPDKADDDFLQPDHIAESVFFLTRQPRSAWTFELDLRPFREKW